MDIEEISANLKRANLRIIGIEEGIEAETKGINNLFREVILENYPNRSRAWRRTLVISVLGRLRPEDLGSRPASAM